MSMNIILLSGGSGKRLWPLSNDIRSKQFIKIFKTSDGQYESMVQRVYRQILAVDPEATVTIATSKSQISALHNQLGDQIDISVEPCRRDTFPAIALAAAYLHDVKEVPEEEAVVICPVDPYVNGDYFEALRELWMLARQGTTNLTLMGINPTYPSEKYGYIIPVDQKRRSRVSSFKEKPDAATAQQYIEDGGLWNGGVFACQLHYVLERARELLAYTDYEDLYDRYDTLPKISFDYAVVEHEPDIEVLRFGGQWKDIGTWNTLSEAMEEVLVGDVRLDDTCAKAQSSYIKPYVDAINQQVMFAEKSWGSYLVLDVEESSMTVKVTLNPGHRMNYHSHDHRDEVWTVIGGTGRTIVDGMEQPVQAGDVITMAAGCRHTVIAETKLQMIEVQLGRDISAADKHKYELDE